MPLTGLFRVEANKWKSRRVPAIADHFLAGEFEFGLPLAAQEFSGGRGRHLNPWSQPGQGRNPSTVLKHNDLGMSWGSLPLP